MDFGSIVGGLGSIFGGMGGNDSVAQPVSGYATLPQEVKDVYEKTYLPGVIEYFKSPYHNVPMMRADDFFAGQPFAPQSARRVQEYSDAIGGLFTPYLDANGNPVGGGADSGTDAGTMAELASMKAAMMRNMGKQALAAGDYRTAAGRLARNPATTDADLAKLFDATNGEIPSGLLAGRNQKPDDLKTIGNLISQYFRMGAV